MIDLGSGFFAQQLHYYDLEVHIYAARRMHMPGEPYWHTDVCIGWGDCHTNPLRRTLASVVSGQVHVGWLDEEGDWRGSWVNAGRARFVANIHFVVPLGERFSVVPGRLRLYGWTCNVRSGRGEYIQGGNERVDDSGMCAFFLPSIFLKGADMKMKKSADFSIAAASVARIKQPEQRKPSRTLADYLREQQQPVSRDQNAARIGAQHQQQGERHGKSYA